MPKLRTHKATRKRFVISKKKKFIARTAGQDHFNSRESSRVTMRKRRDRSEAQADRNALKKMMPYHKQR